MSNARAVKYHIQRIVRRLYEDPVFDRSWTAVTSVLPSGGPIPPRSTAAETTLNEWAVRIQVENYALGESFSVLFFVGTVPEDPSDWRTSPSFAGVYHVFVNSATDQCENCQHQREAHTVVEGFVHINAAIARNSGLGSFGHDVVEPYLRNHNLHWVVQRVSSLHAVCFAPPNDEAVSLF